jgi:SAM-dependent methyltransferase
LQTPERRRDRAPPAPDFGRRAATYDALRPADANWRELYDVLVREGDLRGRRVLDVGCGTGLLAATLAEEARVWGIDPSPEMLAIAKARGSRARFKQARAESLPFKDAWFERALLRLVVHLVERPRAFSELRRILGAGGRAVVATFEPGHFTGYWLNELFPSCEAVDRARFPSEEELERELRAAGFADVRFISLLQRATLDRETALSKIRGRHISTFDLIGEPEYQEGLERAERGLPPRIDYELHWLLAAADVPAVS